ncbi:MAG: hypothetical protein HS104_01960 [Polyangiaceae bacterium]|nr:hypothetical protein [Polyangiaceae bacterium]MCL4753626.1 hypothetical protein [Myxococcales bacterium]
MLTVLVASTPLPGSGQSSWSKTTASSASRTTTRAQSAVVSSWGMSARARFESANLEAMPCSRLTLPDTNWPKLESAADSSTKSSAGASASTCAWNLPFVCFSSISG